MRKRLLATLRIRLSIAGASRAAKEDGTLSDLAIGLKVNNDY